MKDVFLRTAYNYDMDAVSRETALVCEDKSLAHQSFAEECDINTIVRRFNLTGALPDNIRPPQYADFDQVMDYQTALNAVIEAEQSFMAMPADVRSRFSNDPNAFVEFCNDPKNIPEMVKMGLAVDKTPAPVAPVVVPPKSSDLPTESV